jgi:ribonuclease G
MTKELVISANRHETKVAVLEDDQLVEIYFQRANEYSLAGSIHKGRVTRVLPGMQSAFVDLGLERDTFLYVSDFFDESDEYEKLPAAEERLSGGRRREGREGREGRESRNLEARGAEGRERREVQEAARLAPLTEATPEAGATPAEAVPLRTEAEGRERSEPAEAERGERSDRDRGDRDRAERDRADRDRRNRRGRRRRGRGGRGLPESKYAETRMMAAPAGSGVETEPAAAEDDSGIIVLPGESLAKYSRISPEPDEPESGEVDPETSIEAADAAEAEPESGEAPLANDDESILERIEAAEADHEESSPADDMLDDGTLEEEEKPSSAEAVSGDDEDGAGEPSASEDSDEENRLLNPVVDPASGLTEEQLDQIQQQAEAALVTGDSSGESAALAGDIESDESAESEEGGEDESAASTADDAEDAEDAEEAEDTEEAAVADETPAEPVLNADGTIAEPPLASIDSMASSHREQTSRYLRGGRRMRRRRGERGERGERTQRTSAEGGETERPERPPRAERQERSDRNNAPAEPVRTVSREAAGREAARTKDKPQPSITDLLKEGQEIVVQIAKEPLGQKGARITSHVALPGRYCVYMPTVEHLGVSRKIASDEERQRLRRILQTHRQGIPGGFIIRTAGEGKSEEQIAADIQYLYQLWTEIKNKADSVRAPALLYHDVEIVQRLLRDQLTENFKAIWVDNPELYETVTRFVQRMQPQMVSRVKLYTRPVPIFDAFNVTSELEKALRPKVWLKSGGYIVINQTEALVAIDVNTGKFVGKSNRLEDTIVKTNIDAVKEIVRQIRLRDLGGIIVVDFIDMDERKNRQKVMQALEEAMKTDRAPNKILQFNDFGLVAITRKRVKQSLERALCAPCPTCDGSGYVKSVNTVIGEIMIEAQKMSGNIESREVVLRVHPNVALAMKSKDTNYLEELEDLFGRPVLVKGDDSLHPEKYDIA